MGALGEELISTDTVLEEDSETDALHSVSTVDLLRQNVTFVPDSFLGDGP